MASVSQSVVDTAIHKPDVAHLPIDLLREQGSRQRHIRYRLDHCSADRFRSDGAPTGARTLG